MKIYGDCFYGNLLGPTEDGGEGTHQEAIRVSGAAPPPGRARHPPGCLVAPLGAPFRLYNPPGVKTLKGVELPCSSTATERKPTEEKSHLRRADSAGEITSRKGRSSPSSSSSSRASSRSSSTSSPTSAPCPFPSHLISQLQLVL